MEDSACVGIFDLGFNCIFFLGFVDCNHDNDQTLNPTSSL